MLLRHSVCVGACIMCVRYDCHCVLRYDYVMCALVMIDKSHGQVCCGFCYGVRACIVLYLSCVVSTCIRPYTSPFVCDHMLPTNRISC